MCRSYARACISYLVASAVAQRRCCIIFLAFAHAHCVVVDDRPCATPQLRANGHCPLCRPKNCRPNATATITTTTTTATALPTNTRAVACRLRRTEKRRVKYALWPLGVGFRCGRRCTMLHCVAAQRCNARMRMDVSSNGFMCVVRVPGMAWRKHARVRKYARTLYCVCMIQYAYTYSAIVHIDGILMSHMFLHAEQPKYASA